MRRRRKKRRRTRAAGFRNLGFRIKGVEGRGQRLGFKV